MLDKLGKRGLNLKPGHRSFPVDVYGCGLDREPDFAYFLIVPIFGTYQPAAHRGSQGIDLGCGQAVHLAGTERTVNMIGFAFIGVSA